MSAREMRKAGIFFSFFCEHIHISAGTYKCTGTHIRHRHSCCSSHYNDSDVPVGNCMSHLQAEFLFVQRFKSFALLLLIYGLAQKIFFVFKVHCSR